MKFLIVLILVLIAIASCKPSVQICGGTSTIVYPVRLAQTDSLHYEGLPAFHKPKASICATTIMRDSVIINGKDTTTIVNMPPINR